MTNNNSGSNPNSDSVVFSETRIATDASRYPRLPDGNTDQTDYLLRSTAIGLAAGATAYSILPDIVGMDVSGRSDEVASLVFGIAAAVGANIRRAQALCQNEAQEFAERMLNLSKGGVLGLGGAVSIVTLAAAGTVTLTPGIVAVLSGLSLLSGVGYSEIQNRLKISKRCPHCGAISDCSRRVCRNCWLIMFPEERAIDCSRTHVLDSYLLISHLQAQGLNFFQSVALITSEKNNWKLINIEGDFLVECTSFVNWIRSNIDTVMKYKNDGIERTLGANYMRRYLTELGL